MSGSGQPNFLGGFTPTTQCTSRLYPHRSQCTNILGRVFVNPRRAFGTTNAVVLRGINWKFSKLKAACSSPLPVPRPAQITVLLARTSVASRCI